jgi:hypothetical protein
MAFLVGMPAAEAQREEGEGEGDSGEDEGREMGRGAPHLAIRELTFTILEEMQSNMPLCECNRSQRPASPRCCLDRLGHALQGLGERVCEPVCREESEDAHPDRKERGNRRQLRVPLCTVDRGARREPAAPNHTRLAMVAIVPASSRSRPFPLRSYS